MKIFFISILQQFSIVELSQAKLFVFSSLVKTSFRPFLSTSFGLSKHFFNNSFKIGTTGFSKSSLERKPQPEKKNG